MSTQTEKFTSHTCPIGKRDDPISRVLQKLCAQVISKVKTWVLSIILVFGSEPPVVAKSNAAPPARPAQPPQVQTQPYPGPSAQPSGYPGYPPQPPASTGYPGYPPHTQPGGQPYQPPPYPPVTQPQGGYSPYPVQPPQSAYPAQPPPVHTQPGLTGHYKNDTIGDDIMLDSLRTAVGYVFYDVIVT